MNVSELIERLRGLYREYSGGVADAAADGCDDAADALEAQAREIADLQAGWQRTYDHDVARLQERLAAAERERDEVARKYEERVRQHEEYIAFAEEEITGLIEAKRLVLCDLYEAVALLRDCKERIRSQPPEHSDGEREMYRVLARIDAFLAKEKP